MAFFRHWKFVTHEHSREPSNGLAVICMHSMSSTHSIRTSLRCLLHGPSTRSPAVWVRAPRNPPEQTQWACIARRLGSFVVVFVIAVLCVAELLDALASDRHIIRPNLMWPASSQSRSSTLIHAIVCSPCILNAHTMYAGIRFEQHCQSVHPHPKYALTAQWQRNDSGDDD